MRTNVWQYAGLIAAAAVLGLMLGWSQIGAQLDVWAYDLSLRLWPPPAERSAALILAIDDESLEAYGGLLKLRGPLAEALEIISQHDPSVVAIDIVLSEPGSERENTRLEQALRGAPNVVLATHLRLSSGPEAGSWVEPLERFRLPAAALGHVHAEPDDDGVCRRVLLAKVGGMSRRWAMGLEAYRVAHGAEIVREADEGLEVGGLFIPASRREARSLPIRFANPRSPIERISLKQVLEDPASASIVNGRAVFIGVDIAGGIDRYLMTPYSFGKAMSGVEINANVYETLERGRLLDSVADSTVLAATLSLALGIGVCFWKLRGIPALLVAVGLLAVAHLAPVLSLGGDYVLNAAALFAAGWLTFLSGGSYQYSVLRGKLTFAERQRERYQRAVHYVTHEMRTPLTAIQGSSELISRYPLSEEKRKRIAGLIHQESKRLARMIEMFLSVERLRAGQLELQRQAVGADDILARCIERVLPLAGRKQIRIEHVEGTGDSIWGDPEFLEYACYNLLSNAVKYSPASTSIAVRAWHHHENVRISVEDRGAVHFSHPATIRKQNHRFRRERRAAVADCERRDGCQRDRPLSGGEPLSDIEGVEQYHARGGPACRGTPWNRGAAPRQAGAGGSVAALFPPPTRPPSGVFETDPAKRPLLDFANPRILRDSETRPDPQE